MSGIYLYHLAPIIPLDVLILIPGMLFSINKNVQNIDACIHSL